MATFLSLGHLDLTRYLAATPRHPPPPLHAHLMPLPGQAYLRASVTLLLHSSTTSSRHPSGRPPPVPAFWLGLLQAEEDLDLPCKFLLYGGYCLTTLCLPYTPRYAAAPLPACLPHARTHAPRAPHHACTPLCTFTTSTHTPPTTTTPPTRTHAAHLHTALPRCLHTTPLHSTFRSCSQIYSCCRMCRLRFIT